MKCFGRSRRNTQDVQKAVNCFSCTPKSPHPNPLDSSFYTLFSPKLLEVPDVMAGRLLLSVDVFCRSVIAGTMAACLEDVVLVS